MLDLLLPWLGPPGSAPVARCRSGGDGGQVRPGNAGNPRGGGPVGRGVATESLLGETDPELIDGGGEASFEYVAYLKTLKTLYLIFTFM